MVKRLLLSLCALLFLSGCVTPDRPFFPDLPTLVPGAILPFEVVMQDALSQYAGVDPALYLITSPNDAQVVADLLWDSNSKQFLGWVEQLGDGQVLLALFHPPGGSAAYDIRAQRVVLEGDTLYVYTALCHFQMGGAVGTQPFEIVQVTLPPEAPPATSLKPVLVAYDVNC